MIKMRILKKPFSLLIVCCFLSSIQLSQACALERQQELMCSALDNPLFQELTKYLLQDTYTPTAPISQEDVETIRVALLDVPGFIVIYNILMFIYYGRLCLETLDPDPCGSMVTHLVLALFLGILLEGV